MTKSWCNFVIVCIIKTRGRSWLLFLQLWTKTLDQLNGPTSPSPEQHGQKLKLGSSDLFFFFFFLTKTKRCFSSDEVLFLKWSKWKLSCSYCLFVFKTWTRVSPCCRGKKNKGDPVPFLLKNTSAAATAWHVSEISTQFWSRGSGCDTRVFIQRPTEFHAIRSEHVFPPSAFFFFFLIIPTENILVKKKRLLFQASLEVAGWRDSTDRRRCFSPMNSWAAVPKRCNDWCK